MASPQIVQPHSAAWIAQTWVSFLVATFFTLGGIWFLPVDAWTRAFLGMGVLFAVGSATSLAKTLRDMHESQRLVARIDEARFHKLIHEHDPLSPPG